MPRDRLLPSNFPKMRNSSSFVLYFRYSHLVVLEKNESSRRYDAEFQKQMNEYEQERAKFKEAHPEKAKDDEEDPLKYFEDATARELRLIYEAQTGIHMVREE